MPGEWVAFDLGAERSVHGVELRQVDALGGAGDAGPGCQVSDIAIASSQTRPSDKRCEAPWVSVLRTMPPCTGAGHRCTHRARMDQPCSAQYWRLMVVGTHGQQHARVAQLKLLVEGSETARHRASRTEQEPAVASFVSVSGVSNAEAESWLQMADGDLKTAVQLWLSMAGTDGGGGAGGSGGGGVARPTTADRADLLARAKREGCTFPERWCAQTEKSTMFEVARGSSEFAAVAGRAQRECPGLRVLRVQRNQNLDMWALHALRVQQFEDDLHAGAGRALLAGAAAGAPTRADGAAMRRAWSDTGGLATPQSRTQQLWHGTDHATAKKIAARGYNRSYSRRAAFGFGVYFAKRASYSAQPQYAKRDGAGEAVLMLSRVLAGTQFVRGSPDMLEAPEGSACVVNDVSDPSIFVTFQDGQDYPEYFVHFQTDDGGGGGGGGAAAQARFHYGKGGKGGKGGGGGGWGGKGGGFGGGKGGKGGFGGGFGSFGGKGGKGGGRGNGGGGFNWLGGRGGGGGGFGAPAAGGGFGAPAGGGGGGLFGAPAAGPFFGPPSASSAVCAAGFFGAPAAGAFGGAPAAGAFGGAPAPGAPAAFGAPAAGAFGAHAPSVFGAPAAAAFGAPAAAPFGSPAGGGGGGGFGGGLGSFGGGGAGLFGPPAAASYGAPALGFFGAPAAGAFGAAGGGFGAPAAGGGSGAPLWLRRSCVHVYFQKLLKEGKLGANPEKADTANVNKIFDEYHSAGGDAGVTLLFTRLENKYGVPVG